ncbi:MAG: hypothetical protein ACLGH0_09255, partial [Thermoanaerobaculia bacterium]
VLERQDFSCDAVATADAAALKLREHDYAYVLVDADADPTAALRASLAPHQNLIVISDDEHATLRKPFSSDELLKTVLS